MTTLTNVPIPRVSRDVTLGYLGELLFNAGFIDEKQNADLDAADRQFKVHVRGAKRGDEDVSPFKTIASMNLTDASGNGTRIDDFLLARLIAEDAHLPFF